MLNTTNVNIVAMSSQHMLNEYVCDWVEWHPSELWREHMERIEGNRGSLQFD